MTDTIVLHHANLAPQGITVTRAAGTISFNDPNGGTISVPDTPGWWNRILLIMENGLPLDQISVSNEVDGVNPLDLIWVRLPYSLLGGSNAMAFTDGGSTITFAVYNTKNGAPEPQSAVRSGSFPKTLDNMKRAFTACRNGLPMSAVGISGLSES